MSAAPSFDDLLAQFEAEALARFIGPVPLTFLEGDVTTALQHGAAAMADAVIRHQVQAFRDTFIDGAKGDALTTLSNDHLNIQRNPATFAQASVAFSRTGGGAGGTLSAGFTVASAIDASGNSVTFTLDTNVTFGSGDNGPHSAGVTAQIAGRAGDVGAGTIVRLTGTPLFSSLVTCTNAATAAGGNDEEQDPNLRVRDRNFWQTLRRGTLGALEQGALTVPSVRVARATEDQSTGIVTLVVSDSDGNSTAQMVSDVIAELVNWKAGGGVVTVLGATVLLVDVTGMLVAEPGVDTSVLGPVAADAIVGRIAKQRQGETLFIDSIKAAALGVDPDALNALVLTTPTVDVVPGSPSQVIRAGVVTIS
ncbi:MAG TPA: baseplate J/gp47 family protein [Xanthobacteraceae bacterium]|nr:baseplate J/gp47 family protein [Xanthobacteraceae bacterium]